MILKKIALTIVSLFVVSGLFSQETKSNADAVLLHYDVQFVQSDVNKGIAKYKREYLILNKYGQHYSEIVISQDKFRELKSFSGEICNLQSKKTIKKISKSDLITFAYSPHMASDSKYSVYEYNPPSYPYSIKYEYEIHYKNGIPHYPAFAPVTGFGLEVKEAKFKVQFPSSNKVRYKTFRLENSQPKTEEANGKTSYEWTLNSFSALEREPFCPSIRDLVPLIIVAPSEFCMDGHCGNMNTWENMGGWISNLLKDKDQLSEDHKNKIKALVKGIDDEKEKVKKLYEYLQANTRYVSMQVGIGGYRPYNASEVARTGYGDCKALSNYMKTMLAVVDIPSLYTIISTTEKNIYADFASLTQMDHVILCVPLKNDTLWLECTTQDLPFNYVHSTIEGHQVLLVGENESKLNRVKSYAGNKGKLLKMNLKIDETGNGQGNVSITYNFDDYENMQYFLHKMDRDERVNYLAEDLNISKINIPKLDIATVNTETPEIKIDFSVSAEKYANKSGNRLFIPSLTIEIARTNLFKNNKRALDIVIDEEIISTDTLLFEIPESYEPEAIPKSIDIDGEFGKYSTNIQYQNNSLQIVQHLYIKKGKYPASSAADFMKFFKDIHKESIRKAVFKKTES